MPTWMPYRDLFCFPCLNRPTERAWTGTVETAPPPEVRAFCMIVKGCKSTILVASFRYSSGLVECPGTLPLDEVGH